MVIRINHKSASDFLLIRLGDYTEAQFNYYKCYRLNFSQLLFVHPLLNGLIMRKFAKCKENKFLFLICLRSA
jgi:hypothetical protein